MKPKRLQSFWLYYGSKCQLAPHYPWPQHKTIVEPFAGSAGYSMRHYSKEVILIEKNPVVASVWQFLINTTPQEVRSIPSVESVLDLPNGLHPGAKALIGFNMGYGKSMPSNKLSSGARTNLKTGRSNIGWNEKKKDIVAEQIQYIKHWQIIEGDYADADINTTATWFVDPPYNGPAGKTYPYNGVNYSKLGEWCQSLSGQVIVCEQEGARWLPFRSNFTYPGSLYKNDLKVTEMIWTND